MGMEQDLGLEWVWRLKSNSDRTAALEIGAVNQKERPYAPPVANSWLCQCSCDLI